MKKTIEKIAKLAKKYGYTEILPKDFSKYTSAEKNVKVLRLFADLEDPYKNTWVQIYETSGMTCIAYYYWSGPSGTDPLEPWTKKAMWEEMINWD
jgi:hypothetical protein